MADLFARNIATEPPDAAPRGEYRDRGAYFTPDLLALRICERLDARVFPSSHAQPQRILEPGCGGGAFLRAAAKTWPKAQLLGIDLVPCCKGPGTIKQQDFFSAMIPPDTFDLILGNPPFDEAERHIRRALELVTTGGHVAFLLRIALAAGWRSGLHQQHPLFRVDPVIPRPSFTGGGSDRAQEYALCVWRKRHRGQFTGEALVWKEPR